MAYNQSLTLSFIQTAKQLHGVACSIQNGAFVIQKIPGRSSGDDWSVNRLQEIRGLMEAMYGRDWRRYRNGPGISLYWKIIWRNQQTAGKLLIGVNSTWIPGCPHTCLPRTSTEERALGTRLGLTQLLASTHSSPRLLFKDMESKRAIDRSAPPCTALCAFLLAQCLLR